MSDGDLEFRDWTIALGVTSAVFFITTLVLACILFVIVCHRIAKLRKERDSRVTGVLQGISELLTVNSDIVLTHYGLILLSGWQFCVYF